MLWDFSAHKAIAGDAILYKNWVFYKQAISWTNFWWVKLDSWNEYSIGYTPKSSVYYGNNPSTVSWTNISITSLPSYWTQYLKDVKINTYTLEDNNNLNNIKNITTNESFLIPKWTKAHIVLAQEWDEVDPARYFKVGYSTNNTTTRPMNVFDWTDWGTADNDKFWYVGSDLFTDSLLSKTDATYSYKLPNDIVRFAKTDWVIGEKVKYAYKGIADLFTGLTEWSDYYLQDTPWAIGAMAGTNLYIIWDALDSDKLLLDMSYNAYLWKSTLSNWTWWTLSVPAWTKVIRWVVYAYISASGWVYDYSDLYIDRYKLSSTHSWIAWTWTEASISFTWDWKNTITRSWTGWWEFYFYK